MNAFQAGLLFVLVGIPILWFVIEIMVPRMLLAWGNVDSWWSPIRLKALPGEMFIMVRGGPKGDFDTVIPSILGHRYNIGNNEIEKITTPEPKTYLSHLGLVWVGFWRYRLWHKVSYDKWEKDEVAGKWGLVTKIRGDKTKLNSSPSIYFRYNMATKIEKAETEGNLDVDAIIQFTVQITNPWKAFFFAGGWESRITAAIQGCFRSYASDKKIEDLRKEKLKGESKLIDLIIGLTGKKDVPANGLYGMFGLEIVEAEFVNFDPTPGDPIMEKALKSKEISRLNAEAKALDGIGDRDMRRNRAEGIKEEVAAWGSNPVGGQVAMAEAIKEAKPNVLGGNIIASVESKRE